ncbi:MAG TPA: DUF3489 domain-containing protein [Rhodocyclaceae bacterium]|nr:DUF3489 domain-containing protein [Rhodocyclaceae bacterium]
MPDLSDTARLVLTSAADRADRLVPILSNKPYVVALNSCTAQTKPGYLERIDAPRDSPGLVIADATGYPKAFYITDAGLAAIGREPPAPAADPEPEPEPAVDIGSTSFFEHPVAQANAASWDRSAKGRQERVRLAAEQLLASLDEFSFRGEHATQRAELRTALDALKGAPPRQRASSPAPRAAGAPSKQDQAIALLARPNGATGPEIEEALGWAPHTVRAFVSTLGKTRVVTRTKLSATDTERACTCYSISG